MKRLLLSLILITLLLSSCGKSTDNSDSPTSEAESSTDYSKVITSLPDHDDEIYKTAENLLGVTEEPNKIVGRYKETNLKKEYETLASDVYVTYSFEHEDGTASQVYIYYFFDTKENYDKAYNSFCITNGSPSIKNEKSLFFGNGGSAEIYMQGRPQYSDILLYFQINSIEIIYSWSDEAPSESTKVSISES